MSKGLEGTWVVLGGICATLERVAEEGLAGAPGGCGGEGVGGHGGGPAGERVRGAAVRTAGGRAGEVTAPASGGAHGRASGCDPGDREEERAVTEGDEEPGWRASDDEGFRKICRSAQPFLLPGR